jgi:hypothetical protein
MLDDCNIIAIKFPANGLKTRERVAGAKKLEECCNEDALDIG